MKYSKEQYEDILLWGSDDGLSWEEVTTLMNSKWGLGLNEESCRSLFRRTKKRKERNPAPKKAKPLQLPALKTITRDRKPLTSRNDRILFISDMHIPYQHPDTVAFLTALKAKYKPTRVVCLGDELDKHAMSFHDSDPDLPSAGDELQLAIEELQPIYKLFPVVDLVDSNHGSMHYRKGKHHGIPRKYLRDYNEILEAPKGWVWHPDLTLILPDGNELYIHHGLNKDVMKVVNQRGMCVVEAHYHTEFRIGYSGNPNSLLWGMQIGCLIDGDALAFAYDKNNLGRPIIGTGAVLDGLPKLLPMVLNEHGRWIREVP